MTSKKLFLPLFQGWQLKEHSGPDFKTPKNSPPSPYFFSGNTGHSGLWLPCDHPLFLYSTTDIKEETRLCQRLCFDRRNKYSNILPDILAFETRDPLRNRPTFPSHALSAFPVTISFVRLTPEPMLSPLYTQIPVAGHSEPHSETTNGGQPSVRMRYTPTPRHVAHYVCRSFLFHNGKSYKVSTLGSHLSEWWTWRTSASLETLSVRTLRSSPTPLGAATSRQSTVAHHSSERWDHSGCFSRCITHV